MMAVIDLNADLGEEAGDDAAMMDLVTSASVACGFHAGGPAVMAETASLAAARGVVLGAHPSYPDRESFGRRDQDIPRAELVAGIAYQVGAMIGVASVVSREQVAGRPAAGRPVVGRPVAGRPVVAAPATCGQVRFVKLHGALYNQAAADPAIAEAVIEAALGGFADLAILCPPGSELARRAAGAGLSVAGEGFADRAYRRDGSLVPRSEPEAVLNDPAKVAAQAVRLAMEGRFDSICLHGDTPGAVDLARAARRALEEAGVEISPFG